MSEWLLTHEAAVRLSAFVAIVLLMGSWEVLAPRRALTIGKAYRWLNNWGVVTVNTLLLRLIFPAAAVGIALLVAEREWGLFHWLDAPLWLAAALCVIALDLVVWAQHVLFHKVEPLWRLHRMHHADLDFDLTTGLRFHPLEILLSMGIKGVAIAVLGAPAIAVLIFEVLLNGLAMFNHANVRMPARIDRLLRRVIVTPDMHRVHHSWHRVETDSNYGFNLSWWDRLFRTYRDQPRDGHIGMTIGLRDFRELRWERLDRMLIQPFFGPAHSAPVGPGDPTRRRR